MSADAEAPQRHVDRLSETQTLQLIAADAVLALHALFVLFVVGGLVSVYAGRFFRWHWVRNRAFRVTHLAAVAIVVIQSWLGMICPLTIFEMSLRADAGDATYTGSFIAHWIARLLYYDAPAWLFVACYSVFGAAVIASWFIVPPRRKRAGTNPG